MEGQEISVVNHQSSKSKSVIKSLSILVVDDDTTCLSIVAAILKSWRYQVLTVKHPSEALNALQIEGSSFDLVITDVHMPDMDGFELQKQIDQEFKLPVVFMSADDQDRVMIKGLQNGASFFLPKPVSPNDLKHLWQYAFANKKGKVTLEKIEAPKPEKPCNENTPIPETISPIANDISNEANERKMKASMREEINNANATPPKKAKFVWTSSLHNQFLEAIRRLGLEKAVPKKILEIMNIPGLTREHIASHLQKYRLFVKKVSETRSGIQFHRLQSASAPVLPSDFLSRKYSFGGSFPISRSPNLGLSSSFNQRHPFSTSVTPGFGNVLSTLLYNGINSKQTMIGRSKLFPDTNSLVYVNKSTFPLYGNFSKRVAIGQEEPQMTQKGVDNGLNVDMPGFGKIGAFSHQKFDSDPNFKGFAKLGTFENKELEGSTNVVVEKELLNGMGNESMNTVLVLGGTCGETLSNQGVSSSSTENQLIFELTPQHQNDNIGGNNVGIFDRLDDLSDSGNNCFLQQFGDQGDASCAWMNQANIQSQTQQSAGGEELIPNFGISRSPSPDQIFQSFDQNSFQIDEEEFLRSLFSPGKDGGDRHSGTY